MAFFPEGVDHKEYIRSHHWQRRRRMYYIVYEKKCAICGTTEAIELHHHHYRNLFNEQDEDLTPLCQFHHYLVHVFAESARIELENAYDAAKRFLALLDLQHLGIGRYSAPPMRKETERDRFYAQEQDCGHGLIVRFGKGDWFHTSDGTICNQEPEAPPLLRIGRFVK